MTSSNQRTFDNFYLRNFIFSFLESPNNAFGKKYWVNKAKQLSKKYLLSEMTYVSQDDINEIWEEVDFCGEDIFLNYHRDYNGDNNDKDIAIKIMAQIYRRDWLCHEIACEIELAE